MIIPLDAENYFKKIQYHLKNKSPSYIRDTRDIPKHNKDSEHQAHRHQLKKETKSNSNKIRNKTILSALSIPIQYSV